MSTFRRISVVEQTTEHLREGLRSGRWRGQLPGAVLLATELGISINTLRAALRIVEAEGLVQMGANGRSRHVSARASRRKRPLRIGILLFEPLIEDTGQSVQLFLGLQHALEMAGFTLFFSQKTQCGLDHDVNRIARYVAGARADAWVVSSGSRLVLEWFAAQPLPVLAISGRRQGLPLASVGLDKSPAMLAATRRLIALGHRRIVYLFRRVHRLPELSPVLRPLLAELAAHGCAATEGFVFPDWEETPAGLHTLFTALFHSTPPTALFLDETHIAIAAQQFLAERQLRVPEEVSLVNLDPDACFQWCRRPIAHIAWRIEPMVRRIVQWANAVSQHQPDVRQVVFSAEFILGGTIGPAKR